MKITALIFSLLLVAAPAAIAAVDTADAPPGTAEAGEVALFLTGGLNMPQGDMAEGTKKGASIGAGMVYNLNSRFGVGGEIVTNRIGLQDEGIEAFGDDASVSMSILRYSAFMTMAVTQPSKQTLYLKGTAGSYDSKLKVRLAGLEGESSSSDLGFGIGAGFQIAGRSNTALNFETLYHHISADEGSANFLTTTVGVLFSIK